MKITKVSVAMATYNGEKYIEEQLESIRKQERTVDEVVICDDCSTDKTVEIVKNFIFKYKLVNWHLYLNEKNLGYVKNFRHCFRLTSGNIIFIADQDDVWEKTKTAIMVDIMEKSPEILVLSSCWQLINADGEIFRPYNVPEFQIAMETHDTGLLTQMNNDVYYENHTPGCCMAIKRSLCNEYLTIDSELPHDWILNMLGQSSQGVYRVNKSLFKYRLHNSNTIGFKKAVSKTKSKDKAQENLQKVRDIKERLETVMATQELNSANKVFLEAKEKFYLEKSFLAYLKLFASSNNVTGSLKKYFKHNWADFRDVFLR